MKVALLVLLEGDRLAPLVKGAGNNNRVGWIGPTECSKKIKVIRGRQGTSALTLEPQTAVYR